MTLINAKKILFGIMLSMLLVIPVGISQSFAETTDTITEKIDKLIEKYNSLENKRHNLLDRLDNPVMVDFKKEQLQKKYDRVVSKMSSIEDRVERLATQEQSEKRDGPPKRSPRGITIGSIIFAGDDHRACSNWELSTTTMITGAISTGSDTIDWRWNAPDYKSAGWFNPFCTDVYFEDITINTRNISKHQSCTQTLANTTTGDKTQTCNCGINFGNILSWQIDLEYDELSGGNTSGNETYYGMHRVA